MLKYEVYAPYRPVIGSFAWLESQHQSSAAWLVEHTPTQTCRFKSQSQISKTSNLTENYIQAVCQEKTKLLYTSTGLSPFQMEWSPRHGSTAAKASLISNSPASQPTNLMWWGEERRFFRGNWGPEDHQTQEVTSLKLLRGFFGCHWPGKNVDVIHVK